MEAKYKVLNFAVRLGKRSHLFENEDVQLSKGLSLSGLKIGRAFFMAKEKETVENVEEVKQEEVTAETETAQEEQAAPAAEEKVEAEAAPEETKEEVVEEPVAETTEEVVEEVKEEAPAAVEKPAPAKARAHDDGDQKKLVRLGSHAVDGRQGHRLTLPSMR